jgi:hypothetical protein
MRLLTRALIAAVATTGLASAASATVMVGAAPGGTAPVGSTITYDFDSNIPTGTNPADIVGPGSTANAYAQPLASLGHFFSVGPSTTASGGFSLGSNIGSFSFIWGSIDTYNTLTLTTAGGVYTYSGTYIASLIPTPANGNQGAPQTNPIVTFFLSGADQNGVSLSLASTQNAFEIDDVAVNGVPEPATWAMMLLGFGAIGVAVRRRRKTALPQLA